MGPLPSVDAPRPADADPCPGFDLGEVVGFLRAQTSALAEALGDGSELETAMRALAGHDTTHPLWIDLIARTLRCRGHATADLLAAVYACHGRAAGALEHRTYGLLEADIADRIRAALIDQLWILTDQAVAALAAPASGPEG